MSKAVTSDIRGKSLVICFTRPEIRNPLSIEVLDAISALLGASANAKGIERIVFTGMGNAFASGADLREIGRLNMETSTEFALHGQRVMAKIAGCQTTTLAAINGFCYGGALDLAVACSRRIAAPTATFCHPGAGLGIITGWGGTQRVPRLIGQANALELFLTAMPIGADRAKEMGLIDSISADPLTAGIIY